MWVYVSNQDAGRWVKDYKEKNQEVMGIMP